MSNFRLQLAHHLLSQKIDTTTSLIYTTVLQLGREGEGRGGWETEKTHLLARVARRTMSVKDYCFDIMTPSLITTKS